MKMFSLPTSSQDLDVGPIERADRDRAVELELHVAGAGSFRAGERDLLAQIGRGNDPLRERDPVVRQENHFQFVLELRIAIEDLGDLVDQFDNQLRHEIARRGFGAEHERARDDVEFRILFEPVDSAR